MIGYEKNLDWRAREVKTCRPVGRRKEYMENCYRNNWYGYSLSIMILFLFVCDVIGQTSNTMPCKKEYFKYKGKIGNNSSIIMDISIGEENLTGTYYYDKIGIPIKFTGKFSDSNNYELYAPLKEHCSDYFRGKYNHSDTIKGIWSNTQSKKNLPYELIKITNGIAPVSFEIYKAEIGNSRIRVELPIIATTNDSINRLINGDLLRTIINIINQRTGKKYASIKAFINDKDNFSEENGQDFYIEYGCDVETNENNILSFDFSFFSFSKGSAHPSSDNYLVNINITTGNKITLNELLIPGYKNKLNSLGSTIYSKDYPNGPCGKIKLNTNFGITHYGLRFQYYDYELGFHGAPDILIPYCQIASLIDKNGCLNLYLPSKELKNINTDTKN